MNGRVDRDGEPTEVAQELVQPRVLGLKQRIADYTSLTKPRIMTMSLLTVWGSMSVSVAVDAGHWPSHVLIAATLIGVALAVAAGGALNCFLEREHDALMIRTAQRPLPAGRLRPWEALTFGTVLWIVSYFLLYFLVNPLTAYLTMLAFGSYVGLYTPMKRRSPWCTVVGAIPGALPPLIGSTAILDRIDPVGLALFAILFVWQIPHFLSFAILRRDEYAQAGMPMMPVVCGPRRTIHAIVLGVVILIPLSFLPVALMDAGRAYVILAAVLDGLFLIHAIRGLVEETNAVWCRSFFQFSIIYLGLLFTSLVIGAT